jgi:NAD(P)-dependent dehydrogenase (short-subunit alcohol dehydrogenase family)
LVADLEHPRPAIAGRRVLITGASSGIGLASARILAADGARLALASRGDEALAEAAASVGPRAVAVPADVTDAAGLARAVDEAATALGGLDAVVANAGAAAYGPFPEMEPADYLRTVDITLSGALITAHASLPHLRRTHGTLVFVGSVAGRVAVPWLAAYAAAKHGVRGFARSLRAELRALDVPVEVALVAPGPVDTPFWRHARTTDGRLSPRVLGAYRADDVAAEVLRALERPRIERTVGGLMAAWVLFDALAPRAALRLTGAGARLGWRRRERRPVDGTDALAGPVGSADVGGGLPARPSVLRRLRDRTLTP